MTPAEFQRASRDLLTEAWGDKSYPPAQLQKLWQIVGDISVQEFKLGLETLSMTCNRAPALGQIRAACLPAIMKAQNAAKEAKIKRMEEKGEVCPLCANGGYVWVIPFDDPLAEGVFLCTCEAARIRGYLPNHGMTYWHVDLEHKYYVRRFTGPGWEGAEKLQAPAFKKLWPKKRMREEKSDRASQEPRSEQRQIEANEDRRNPSEGSVLDGVALPEGGIEVWDW